VERQGAADAKGGCEEGEEGVCERCREETGEESCVVCVVLVISMTKTMYRPCALRYGVPCIKSILGKSRRDAWCRVPDAMDALWGAEWWVALRDGVHWAKAVLGEQRDILQ
jgi:hypothetical protein